MAQRTKAQVYDELLVTLVRGGDRRAAERLAARWYPKLMRTALRLLQDREQAQDAVQEAWAGICRGWVTLSDPTKFPAWAFSILHRKCADRIRFEQTDRSRRGDMPEGEEPAFESASELGFEIDQALSALSQEHRVAAILYFGDGLTLAEVAGATGVPLGTAKSRIFHARKQLKMSLKGDT